MKEYLEDEILNLEVDMQSLGTQKYNIEMQMQYKKGRLEAYKATLAHLLKAN